MILSPELAKRLRLVEAKLAAFSFPFVDLHQELARVRFAYEELLDAVEAVDEKRAERSLEYLILAANELDARRDKFLVELDKYLNGIRLTIHNGLRDFDTIVKQIESD